MMHPTPPPKLLDLLYGELPPDEATRLIAHINADPHLRQAWANLQQTRSTLRSALDADAPTQLQPTTRANVLAFAAQTANKANQKSKQAPTPAPARALRWRPILAFAASILLATSIFWLLPQNTTPSHSDSNAESHAAPTVIAHAPNDSTPPSAAPTPSPPPADPASNPPNPPKLAADTPPTPNPSPEPTPPPSSDPSPPQNAQTSQNSATSTPPIANKTPIQKKKTPPKPQEPIPDPAPKQVQQVQQQQQQIQHQDTQTPPFDPAHPDSQPQDYAAQYSNSAQYQDFPPTSLQQPAPQPAPSAQAFIARAESSIGEQRLDAGVEFLTQAIEHSADIKDELRARSLRAQTFQELGQHREAIEDLQVILQSNPDPQLRRQAEFAFAVSLIATGSPQTARNYLSTVAAGEDALAQQARDRLDALDELYPNNGPEFQQKKGTPASKKRSNSDSNNAGHPAPKSSDSMMNLTE